MRKFLFVLFTICFIIQIKAQSFNLAKITKEEVKDNNHAIDTSSKAIILNKIRKNYFQYTKQGNWELVTEIQKRIKILKSSGLQYGVEQIVLNHTDEKSEVLKSVKAIVYNLKNNKLYRSKLKKGDITEIQIDNKVYITLNLPDIEIGSVIEIKYKIISPFIDIKDLVLQEKIPIKQYYAEIKIPEFFKYRRVLHGNPNFRTNENERFLDLETLSTKKRYELPIAGIKKVVEESVLQVKEVVTQYEIDNVPAFNTKMKSTSQFRIIYELIRTYFPD